ncbi:Cuticle protein CPCFC [Popillia japonica]|uniref:Cuticle protein CPCFC n=1 Tax=Popillia japonica TaxID=7064 RepID=A0AAW1L8J5_POPJA
MFVKLAVLACTFAFALGAWHGPLAGGVPAHQFPAGVSPQACPNYPNCNNPAVAAAPNAPGAYPGAYNQGAYNPGAYNGGYNAGAYNPGAYNGGNNALDNGQYTGDGDYHGEGLAESGAYGNVDGGYNGGAYNPGAYNQGAYNPGAYNPGHAAAPVPAGVDPHSCPNYPFCH